MATPRVTQHGGFTQAQWKDCFFDSARVVAALSASEREVLARFGSYTRVTAKRSIRKRNRPSLPGNPPSSHVGTLKRGIRAGIDINSKSVIIGPVKYPMPGNVPETLEKGGRARRHKNKRRKIRKVGDTGIIVLGRSGNSSAVKRVRDNWGHLRWATFARLNTPAQVRRSMELEEEVYGPLWIGGRVEKRPYMLPAFERELALHPPAMLLRQAGRT